MPIDYMTAGTPGWWLRKLITKLADERPRFEELDCYYRGENGIPTTADKAVRNSYKRLMRLARTNFAELIVEAPRERMKPVGFRTGADGDELGDKGAWRIWQANGLDADSPVLFRSKLSMSMAYSIVGGVDPDIDAPLITMEDPREVTVITEPGRRRKVAAALKVFRDDLTSTDRVYLYLPGVVWYAARNSSAGDLSVDTNGWEWTDVKKLPAMVVPVVPFPNRADMHGRTMGEFEPHISLLDRISYTTLNMLEIGTMQAFRQRALKGVPRTDENGDEIDYDDILAADPGAFWLLPSTAELWESGQVDLGPARLALRDHIQDLAAVTRTPLYYLTPDSANGSAEGASLSREGLVFRTKDRITETDDPLEQTMSLAFLFQGDKTRASRPDMEVLWAPPDRVSMAEMHDANIKAKAGDVPWRTRMQSILGFSPPEIERMETEREQELLLAPPTNAAV